MAQLEDLMHEHFVDYASYFILDRAIPDLRDGLKPVQRRLLHTLFTMDDGRYHKVANAIGETMKLHPHGDASIGDALVVLANKGYFIDGQGNFGNILTGHPAAAARYIECRLTPLALETMFFRPLTEFVPSYDGRSEEPVFLPAKLPVALMIGAEGIAVGMATKILPHNLAELWEAQIDLLNGKKVELYPDFLQGGLMDVAAYDDGAGKVEVRARIRVRDSKHVVIDEIPHGTTTESVIASIENAAQKGRLKISSIDDFTTDKVEIEITVARGTVPKAAIRSSALPSPSALSALANAVSRLVFAAFALSSSFIMSAGFMSAGNLDSAYGRPCESHSMSVGNPSTANFLCTERFCFATLGSCSALRGKSSSTRTNCLAALVTNSCFEKTRFSSWIQPGHQSEPVKFTKISRFFSAACFFAASRSVSQPSVVAIAGRVKRAAPASMAAPSLNRRVLIISKPKAAFFLVQRTNFLLARQ